MADNGATMNKFANDGSFLEMFKQLSKQNEQPDRQQQQKSEDKSTDSTKPDSDAAYQSASTSKSVGDQKKEDKPIASTKRTSANIATTTIPTVMPRALQSSE